MLDPRNDYGSEHALAASFFLASAYEGVQLFLLGVVHKGQLQEIPVFRPPTPCPHVDYLLPFCEGGH